MTPLKSIVIIGDGLRGAVPAAYLAARLKGSGTRITVVPTKKPEPDKGEILARPNIRHFHQLLQIPEKQILGPAQGRRIYAYDIEAKDGVITLPFGAYAKGYKGAGFAQLYARLSQIKAQKKHHISPLAQYNLNLRLHSLGKAAPNDVQADFGYTFPREHYTGMMQHYAQSLGAVFSANIFGELIKDGDTGHIISMTAGGKTLAVDCVINARDMERSAWEKNCLHLPTSKAMPSAELYRLQMAMDRLSNFMPDQNFNGHELSEFNRLTELETERIADMEALLNTGVAAGKNRPCLARKIDVFSQRGRIPSEDYEVFSGPEWRAALMGLGLTPRYYDRLVDGLSEVELRTHIDLAAKDIDAALGNARGRG